MVGERTIGVGNELDLAISDQLVDEFCVVLHHVVAAELRVFIGDGVETVRTSRNDNLGLHRVQSYHVFRRHLGEEILVASTAR